MRYSTISAIGSFTALTSSTADYLRLDPTRCSGGTDAPVRLTIEANPGFDGAKVFPAYDDAQIITLGGDLVITSSSTESGYFSAEDTLMAALKTALDAMKASPDNLVHSGGTLSVAKYAPISESRQGFLCGVTFSLVVSS